uniref:Uncharacterized protein n=1 Tax=Nelumbo nucifera TaxID=4432 RepID=A0A822YXM7_NELNU|nr:TPA_asm: hypothetical protein HUJ06_007938 [Nelumbo nucifera]
MKKTGDEQFRVISDRILFFLSGFLLSIGRILELSVRSLEEDSGFL